MTVPAGPRSGRADACTVPNPPTPPDGWGGKLTVVVDVAHEGEARKLAEIDPHPPGIGTAVRGLAHRPAAGAHRAVSGAAACAAFLGLDSGGEHVGEEEGESCGGER